jgi:hypothetical protein
LGVDTKAKTSVRGVYIGGGGSGGRGVCEAVRMSSGRERGKKRREYRNSDGCRSRRNRNSGSESEGEGDSDSDRDRNGFSGRRWCTRTRRCSSGRKSDHSCIVAMIAQRCVKAEELGWDKMG